MQNPVARKQVGCFEKRLKFPIKFIFSAGPEQINTALLQKAADQMLFAAQAMNFIVKWLLLKDF